MKSQIITLIFLFMSIISLAGSIRVKDPYFFGFDEGLNLTKYKNYKRPNNGG